ncbi:hypothetical protein HOLleu_28153 [Holothuria leucospilota]|uniref:MULE transposase domain-containing protein n=1 Tax=Holothuria leucospilota TaxID=206669 RepID=A0A9Q1BLS1_HOLLE|nr:hypothetical protein HOLleu_28153 [Holothuria leucospilota]
MAQPPRLIQGERRGGQILVHDGYRYQRNRAVVGRKIYWRCADPLCRAPLQTNYFVPGPDANIAILGPVPQPNHPHRPEVERIDRHDFLNNVKDTIEQDPSLPIRRAYNTEYLAIPAQRRQDVPTFEEIRSTLQRHRMSFIPMVPRDVHDVDIQGPWAETWDGNRKLLAIDNDVGVCIFASDEELRTLSHCRELFIDGTFKTAPHPYTQIITIHGKYHGWTLPFVMALSTGKTEAQYRFLLREVRNAIQGLTNNNFEPNFVVTDFEVALINAIDHELRSETRGCYFHFCQSLMRKVSDLGLKGPYERDPDVQQVVRRMLALGYLPAPHVRLMFVTYTAGRRVQEVIQRFPNLQLFFDYIENTYINGPVFRIGFWNVHNRRMDSRTNNYSEGFFSKWNRELMVRHPNIWFVIRRIKNEGEKTRLKSRRADMGDRRPKRKLKWRKLERRITNLRRSLRRGDRNLRDYWSAVVYVTKAFA